MGVMLITCMVVRTSAQNRGGIEEDTIENRMCQEYDSVNTILLMCVIDVYEGGLLEEGALGG